METRTEVIVAPALLPTHPPRCVEPAHGPSWPVRKPAPVHECPDHGTPFHEALEASGRRLRDADRVEFSGELRRLNAEQRLRDLSCDEPHPCDDAAKPDPCERSDAPSAARELPRTEETTEVVRTVEHRYEVTHRSTTGRLIDMVM